MKFEELIEEAKRLCGSRRVYSKDNTAFLIDGIVGFGNRHNIWFRDADKKIHIFAKNVSFENMSMVLRGLYGNPEVNLERKNTMSPNDNKTFISLKSKQMELFDNETKERVKQSNTRKSSRYFPEYEDDYGNYTFEDWERNHPAY